MSGSSMDVVLLGAGWWDVTWRQSLGGERQLRVRGDGRRAGSRSSQGVKGPAYQPLAASVGRRQTARRDGES